MEYQLRKVNQKRRRDCELKPDAKRQKRDRNHKFDSTKEAAPIEKLCYELLEKIFAFLDPQNLLNVAGTCKRLQIAAAATFGKKFGGKRTVLYSEVQHIMCVVKKGVQYYKDCIQVFGINILPFLRCFGANVSNLIVVRTDNHVNRYINRYCANTLISIEFRDIHKEVFLKKKFPKPFKMVEKIKIADYSFRVLGKKFAYYSYWFPKLRQLEFFHTYNVDFNVDFKEASFPHLQHLTIQHLSNERLPAQTIKHIESLLHANPQLQSLNLPAHHLTITNLLDIINRNPKITKLMAVSNSIVQWSTAEVSRFVKERSKMVDLNLQNYVLNVEDAVTIARKLKYLKTFCFQIKDGIEYNRLLVQLKYVPNIKDIIEKFCLVYLTFDR